MDKDLCLLAAQTWLAKARSDLDSARILIKGDEPKLDTGVYHCQQAAEKSLKAWLCSNGVPFPKTHELEVLLDSSVSLNSGFEAFRNQAEMLTPFATEYRYPGDFLEPLHEDALAAWEASSDIFHFVEERLTVQKNEGSKDETNP